MYTVAVKRDFIARHYLIGGDWGAENEMHSHHYQIELQLHGESLDEHGYLVDIVDIERILEALVDHYREAVLNEQAEFQGLNPSLEHFCRIIAQSLSAHIRAPNVRALTVRLWENQIAWASYHIERAAAD